jgi:hypothetical protein
MKGKKKKGKNWKKNRMMIRRRMVREEEEVMAKRIRRIRKERMKLKRTGKVQ